MGTARITLDGFKNKPRRSWSFTHCTENQPLERCFCSGMVSSGAPHFPWLHLKVKGQGMVVCDHFASGDALLPTHIPPHAWIHPTHCIGLLWAQESPLKAMGLPLNLPPMNLSPTEVGSSNLPYSEIKAATNVPRFPFRLCDFLYFLLIIIFIISSF